MQEFATSHLSYRVKTQVRGSRKIIRVPLAGIHHIRKITIQPVLNGGKMLVDARYIGVGPSGGSDNTFVQNLNKQVIQNLETDISYSAGSSQHLYYCHPKRLGLAEFKGKNFQGGFLAPREVSVTDPDTGGQETFYVWESLNDDLGNVTVHVQP